MRICRITSVFVPPWTGLGPGPFELSAMQADLGHNVTVITKYTNGCESLDPKTQFKIYRIKTKRNLPFSLLAAIKFLSLHRKNRFDIVHSHGESGLVLLLLRPLLRLEIPILSSVHIVRKAQYKTINKARIREQLVNYADRKTAEKITGNRFDRKELFYEKLYFRLSDALAAVNKSVAEQIEEEYGIVKNVNVIFNGVNIDKFFNDKSCYERAVKIKSSMCCKYLLLFVGVLNGRKGELDLIKAMHQVVCRYNDTTLMIVGDGPTKQIALDMVEKLQLRKYVKFIANMEQTELKKYYLAGDLFILPSYSEGLPKVLLEAMACGIPVIASDIPAHRELIEHGVNGHMFEVGNVDSLASIILEILDKPEGREGIIRNAKELVEKKFTWQSVANRLDEVYCDLLGRR